MKTITTSKGEFVVMDGVGEDFAMDLTYMILNDEWFVKLSEATEEDAKFIVDEPEYIPCYNCLNGCPVCGGYGYSISWTNELYSLLKSKGVDVDNGNWYLFKKI